MKNIAAVLFDLDGVIVNSYDAWFMLFNQALKHFGYAIINEKTFGKHWGQSTEEDVRIFMPGKTVDDVREYFNEHFNEYISFLKVDRGAKEILQKCKNLKLKQGCVTNSHHKIVKEILNSNNFTLLFDVVITADEVEKPKPAPDMILKACAELKVRSDETVFLGDTITDVKAGKEAGCIVVGYGVESEFMVENLQDFYKLLTKLIQS